MISAKQRCKCQGLLLVSARWSVTPFPQKIRLILTVCILVLVLAIFLRASLNRTCCIDMADAIRPDICRGHPADTNRPRCARRAREPHLFFCDAMTEYLLNTCLPLAHLCFFCPKENRYGQSVPHHISQLAVLRLRLLVF